MSNRIRTRLLGACAVVLLGVVLAGCNGSTGQTTTTEEITTTTVSTETTTTTTEATTTTAPAGVEVPDVTGLNFDEAFEVLDEAGFEAVISDSYAAGTVADLDTVAGSEPAAGERVEEGASVAVQLYAVPSDNEAEAIASIEQQGHEIITGFLDRVNRIDPNVGPTPLKDTDPYGGALRSALRVTDELTDWAAWCNEAGLCGPDRYDTDYNRFGRIEVLRHVGEGLIHPYGDGSYYVDAVYSGYVGHVLNTEYYVGFRFTVEEGRAVLIDVAMSYGDIKNPRPIWLSELKHSNPEPVTAESLNGDVTVQVLETTHRADFGRHPHAMNMGVGNIVNVLEVTNNGDTTVKPWAFGLDIEGFQADEWNNAKAGWAEEGGALDAWNFVYGGIEVSPGETASVVVAVRYVHSQLGGGPFHLTVLNSYEAESPETAEPLFEVEIELAGGIDRCATRLFPGDTLEQRQCLEPVGYDHQWSG